MAEIGVIETAESLEEVDGEYTKFRTRSLYITDCTKENRSRTSAPKVNIQHLTHRIRIPIPIAAHQPLFSSSLTRAPEPLPADSYAKRPRSVSYDRLRNSCGPTNIAVIQGSAPRNRAH